ncbi:MAG: hypothetical protein WA652_08245 [Xanthobacteraceae bacterium]
MPPPSGETEDQNDIRLLREQGFEVAIDRALGCRKNVAGALDRGQGRPAPAHQRFGQKSAWVKRRGRKRTEAGDQCAHGVTVREFW